MTAPGATETGRGSVAAGWLVLALAGYAATLQLIVAGPVVRYQHYLPPWELGSAPALAVAIVLAEVLLVLAGLARHRAGILATVRQIRGWRLALLLTAVCLTSSTLSRDPKVYVVELVVATFLQLIHLGAVGLAALSLPRFALEQIRRWADRCLGPPVIEPRPRVDRLALALAALTTLVCYGLAVWVYQRHPHLPDETVYLLPARYFAAGRLGLNVPAPMPGFELDLMFVWGNRWFSPVPPGWPMVLALGSWLGAPWLVNPVLAGINIVLASVLLQQLYDRRTARLGTLLLGLSPWHLFMGMNVLTHEVTLTLGLAAAVALGRWHRTGGPGWAVAAGFGAGLASLVRPLDGLAIALALGCWCLTASTWPRRLAGGLAAGIGAIIGGALTLPYNAALMGVATRFPIMAYTDTRYGPGTNSLGFGPNRGLGWTGLDPFPGHGLLDVLINANMNLFSTNIELFGWAAGSMLPLAGLLFLGRLTAGDRRMLGAALVVIGLHSFYWFSGGPDFGARYWYLIIVPGAALAASAIRQAEAAVGSNQSPRVLAVVVSLVLGALLVFMPWRAVDKYYHYRGMRPDVRELARTHHFGRSLVLVAGRGHPDYASAAIYNPLDLDADAPIYAWDRDPETRAALLARYPDRPVWLLQGPTVTGDGYRVMAGPLPPGSPLPAP